MPDTSAHRRAVTVVIPAHGVANYVVGSVASALAQPEATKVVVVDDRSPDEGAALVRGHFDDPRLEVISSERTPGVCGARNAGLERVGTEWVLFLDGDDELIEGALGRLMAAATPRAAGVFGSFRHVTETGEDHPSSWLADRSLVLTKFPQRPLTLRMLPRRTFNPPPGAMLMRTSSLRRCGGWDEGRSSSGQSEDYEVAVRLAVDGPIELVDEPVLRYLHREGSRSRGSSNNRRRALTRFEAIRRAPRHHRPAMGLAQADAYWRLVVPRIRAGRLHPRGLLHAGADAILALAFALFGFIVVVLPPWQPDWPPA